MGKFVFICDIEEGHLIPTFGMAQALKQRGHQITYLSIVENGKFITEQGFDFHPVMEDLYPEGFRKKFKTLKLLPEKERQIEGPQRRRRHIESIINGAYDAFLMNKDADIYGMGFFIPIDILLLHYKYNLRPFLFTPILRDPNGSIGPYCWKVLQNLTLEEKYIIMDFLDSKGIYFNSFLEVVEPLKKLEEIIFCPGEFEIDKSLLADNAHYVEASLIKKEKTIDVYESYKIPGNKKIVYGSMGSQAIRHGDTCDLFFTKLINVMKMFSDLHLILSVGSEYDQSRLGIIPENVTILGWAPQIDIIKASSLVFTHGGLGTIKESIYHGVPMIIFPMGYDQPQNGQRVVHHKLGYTDDIATVTNETLKNYITAALTDSDIKDGIIKMQQVFKLKEKKQVSANVAEEFLLQQIVKA